MKKTALSIIAILSLASIVWAAETMWIHRTDNVTLGMPISIADSVTLSSDGSNVIFNTTTGVTQTMTNSLVEKVTLGASSTEIEIKYNGTDVEIVNPYAFEDVTIEKTGANVVVTSTSLSELRYKLSGTTTNGSFKIYSDTKFVLALNGANITNSYGAAINVQSSKKTTVELVAGTTSNLVDGTSYLVSGTEDQKGCFFSEGQIVFTGTGIVNVTGNYKHGIASDDYVEIASGTVNVLKAGNDGVRVNDYFLMTGGKLTTTNTGGDGVDAQLGYIQIDGGAMDITVATADTKGIKCDGIITMNGGDVVLTVPAAQGKGFKTDVTMTMNGGTITANMTGDAEIITDATTGIADPSYCTAIKCGGDFVMTDGTIDITSTGLAGKGISADGIITISGGTAKIKANGTYATYDSTGSVDTGGSTGGGDSGSGSSGTVSADDTTLSDSDGCISANKDNLVLSGTTSDQTYIDVKITGTKSAGSIIYNPSSSIVTVTPLSDWNTSTGGTLRIALNTGYGYIPTTGKTGYVAVQYDSTHRIKINFTATLTSASTASFQVVEDVEAVNNMASLAPGNSVSTRATTSTYYCAATAIACDSIVNISGGTIELTVGGTAAKGISADNNINITGGVINATLTGGVVVVAGDPTYCSAIKTDTNLTMSAGNITITHSGIAGKGMSIDGNATFTGGTVNITTTGNGGTYTNASNTTDTYCATCIKVDGNATLNAGTFNLSSSGTGGKCLNAGVNLTMGTTAQGPTLTAKATGSQVGSSSGGGGGQPGRPGQPGSSTSSSSSTSPKVIKAGTTFVVNNGKYNISSSAEGGEGFESKGTMTITGGEFYFNTYDDCLNAVSMLTISGGKLRCVATGNDAIDSNGGLTISGGLVLANGTREPEEGVDVDNANQLSITGGTIINQKGNMLNLTTTQCKVPTIKYSSSITAGTLITITNSAGTHILSFKAPQAMSQGCYITLPEFATGSSYKLYKSGTVSGGTTFNEVTTGGTFSGGTLVKSFTISSNLTSL